MDAGGGRHGFEFSRILKPLEPYRDRLNVVSGLGNRAADSTAVHSLSPTTWLSGVRPKPTQGVDAYAGITADQIAAQHIGQDTPLPSIELATEDHSALLGACDRDYGCIYMNTLSWRTHTTPMPMEINPRKAFERMFGQGGTAAERALRQQQDRSILDEITAEAGALKLKLGPRDQATVSDYLDSVREIERRIQRANFDSSSSLELPDEPVGIPYNFEEHINIMYDMLVLAYQANITRVFTYMVAREESNKTYPQVGVHDGHHATSHHQNLPEKIEKLVKIQNYHATLFARFLGKLKSTPDGDGNAAGSFRHPVRQQHEQQQPAQSFPAAESGGGRRVRKAAGRPSPALRRSHADGESAAHAARKGRHADGEHRRQHRRSRSTSKLCALASSWPLACVSAWARLINRRCARRRPRRGDRASEAAHRCERAGARRHHGAALGGAAKTIAKWWIVSSKRART